MIKIYFPEAAGLEFFYLVDVGPDRLDRFREPIIIKEDYFFRAGRDSSRPIRDVFIFGLQVFNHAEAAFPNTPARGMRYDDRRRIREERIIRDPELGLRDESASDLGAGALERLRHKRRGDPADDDAGPGFFCGLDEGEGLRDLEREKSRDPYFIIKAAARYLPGE
ncbi:MAG: hypothetical protein IMZ57_11110 [Acidobacteria bacterium]|nr:hypothetical protein [Acidobacteriota bacterium]